MAFKMAAKGHVTIFFIISSNKSFIYDQHSVKVSQQYVERFWRYSVLNPYTFDIQESLLRYWFFEVHGSESVKPLFSNHDDFKAQLERLV